jgi:GNAT superfamily N-acetyltransferase
MLDLVDRLSNSSHAEFVNGTQVDAGHAQLRPARGGDGEALQQFVGGLSLRTRYLRFFAGVPRVSPAMLHRMTGTRLPNGDLVDALVVTEAGAIIGHGMATDTRDSAGTPVTEVGVVVADGWQGQGVGSALTRALATRAQARGASTVMMEVLAENHEMLALIRNRFPAARYWHAGPYVTIRVPLPLGQEEQPGESAGRPYGPHEAHRERELAGLG